MSRRSPLENPQASVPVENSGLSESADRPAKPKAIGELAPPGPPTTTGTEAGVARGRSARSIALLAGVGLLIVLGVAPLSELVYSQSDRPAGLSLDVSTGAGVPVADAGLRDLPAGLPTGVVIRTVDDVRPYAVQALGRAGADALLAILGSTDPLAAQAESYPYRYSSLESVLDAVPAEQLASGGTALGAALTMLAAQPQPEHSREQATVIDNAGPAAFTVLNRTRASGQCAPQLDMLLLLAGDFGTDTPLLEKEQRLTEAACGDDVTPGWLVGQGQLRRVLASDAVSTMQRVVARHPSNIVALTGLGDANLGAALSLDGKPFTARYFFRESVAAYNRAVDHGGRRDAAPGLARALIGLGEPERAIGFAHIGGAVGRHAGAGARGVDCGSRGGAPLR